MKEIVLSRSQAPPRTPPEALPWLKRLWRAVPIRVRSRLYKATNWTGVPAALRFAANYRFLHAAERFAGELPELLEKYPRADPNERLDIKRQFDAIAEAIVLPNGVRKTTYADRQEAMLKEIFADPACALPDRALGILDIPASTGASSLGARALIEKHRPIGRYVLADLAFHLLYDRVRGCVFDATGALLQVKRGRSFESVYLPNVTGAGFTAVTRAALAPLTWRGRQLRARYLAADALRLERIPLLHPDVLAPTEAGSFIVQEMDVFAPVAGPFDVILSFNLLQRNYFSEAAIARGTANLGDALAEDGLLVLGSPDEDRLNPHRVYRKRTGRLELVRSRGTF